MYLWGKWFGMLLQNSLLVTKACFFTLQRYSLSLCSYPQILCITTALQPYNSTTGTSNRRYASQCRALRHLHAPWSTFHTKSQKNPGNPGTRFLRIGSQSCYFSNMFMISDKTHDLSFRWRFELFCWFNYFHCFVSGASNNFQCFSFLLCWLLFS